MHGHFLMKLHSHFELGITNTIQLHVSQYIMSKLHFIFFQLSNHNTTTHAVYVSFPIGFSSPDPIERYSFVTVGSDWPSMLESSSLSPQPSSPSHKRYANPIKRAWRRRTLRRMLAAARRTYGIVEK